MIILFISSLLSGYQGRVEVKGKRNQSKEIHSIRTRCVRRKMKKENFNFFIKRFMKDSTFQRSRFVFPLIIKTYDPDTDSFAVEVISEKSGSLRICQICPTITL